MIQNMCKVLRNGVTTDKGSLLNDLEGHNPTQLST
jgi:hypothetical protein